MIIKCKDNGMVQGTREYSEASHRVAIDEVQGPGEIEDYSVAVKVGNRQY